MKKEILFAIIAGSILGLIIAFGVWRANVALTNRTNGTSTASLPNPSSKPEFSITLAAPYEKAVITDSQVKVSGVTKPKVKVVVSAESKDYYTLNDNAGGFEANIDLVPGINQLLISAFNEDGSSSSQKVTVVYSSEFEKVTTSASSSTTTSSDEGSVREKVQKKVEEALKNPIAYIGTVTDIVENTIQIKTDSGEIKQTSTDSNTVFVKSIKTPKEVKLRDLAIGDFIISMGLKNGNEVLGAKRILITSAVTPTTRKTVFGTVGKMDKKGFSLTLLKTGENLTVILGDTYSIQSVKDGKTTKIKYSDLNEGDIVLVSGEDSQTGFDVKTVFVLSLATPTPKLTPAP